MELFHEAALTQCNSIDLLWYRSRITNSLPFPFIPASMSQLFNLAIVEALCDLLSSLYGFHEAAHSTAPRLSWNKWVGTEQEHPGGNDQWGHRWTFSNNLQHQRKCIMEQGLRSHFLLFFICFLISSAHVTHSTFLAPQLQDALAAAFTLSFQKTHLSYFGN